MPGTLRGLGPANATEVKINRIAISFFIGCCGLLRESQPAFCSLISGCFGKSRMLPMAFGFLPGDCEPTEWVDSLLKIKGDFSWHHYCAVGFLRATIYEPTALKATPRLPASEELKRRRRASRSRAEPMACSQKDRTKWGANGCTLSITGRPKENSRVTAWHGSQLGKTP